MTHILFLFLDGVGLGDNNPQVNPFARAQLPILTELLEGNRFIADTAPFAGSTASLLALDACLGVDGLPQSATGQATLLTGINVPASLGYHYGPKPNQAVASYLKNGNLFSLLTANGLRAAFLNAYPPRYFAAIDSGQRMYSAIPLAATSAGLPLLNNQDLNAGLALAADFTAQGWHQHLNLTDTPILSPHSAGRQLATLAGRYDFAFFEYWLSDYEGHHQDMKQAIQLLELFDKVIEGILQVWDNEQGLILLTSDHGNIEDLSTRRHTKNSVPALIIGSPNLRHKFLAGLSSIKDVAPAISRLLLGEKG